jgi:hypothetical protein
MYWVVTAKHHGFRVSALDRDRAHALSTGDSEPQLSLASVAKPSRLISCFASHSASDDGHMPHAHDTTVATANQICPWYVVWVWVQVETLGHIRAHPTSKADLPSLIIGSPHSPTTPPHGPQTSRPSSRESFL